MKKFKLGDKVKIIQATTGARGTDGKIGVIIRKPRYAHDYNGLVSHEGGIWVEIMDDGRIWNIGTESKLELISKPQQTEELQMEKGNFKVRCIDNCNNVSKYTVGKVYQFINGHMVDDKGIEFPMHPVSNFDEWDKFTTSDFEPVNDSPQKINIRQDGLTVTATLKQGKEVIKTKVAKCSPTDTFEFGIGAKLAVERLFGMDGLKTDKVVFDEVHGAKMLGDGNFKVECIATRDYSLTVGKVYDIKNGYGEFDSKTAFPFARFPHTKIRPFRNFADLQGWFSDGSETSKFELITTPPITRVSRQAKVGEWVEIVKTINGDSNAYLPGDICKVVDTKKGYGIYASTRGTHSCNVGYYTSYLYNDE